MTNRLDTYINKPARQEILMHKAKDFEKYLAETERLIARVRELEERLRRQAREHEAEMEVYSAGICRCTASMDKCVC